MKIDYLLQSTKAYIQMKEKMQVTSKSLDIDGKEAEIKLKLENNQHAGEKLKGNLAGTYSYRVNLKIRILYSIEDVKDGRKLTKRIIKFLKIDYHKQVYGKRSR